MKQILIFLLIAFAGNVTQAQVKVAVLVADVGLSPTKQEFKKLPPQYWKDQPGLEAVLAQQKLTQTLGASIAIEGKAVAIMPAATVRASMAEKGIETKSLLQKKPAELCQLLGCDYIIFCNLARATIVTTVYNNGTQSNSVSYEVGQQTRIYKSGGAMLLEVTKVSSTGKGLLSIGFKAPDTERIYTNWAEMTARRLNNKLDD
jgi:hypothetical protein